MNKRNCAIDRAKEPENRVKSEPLVDMRELCKYTALSRSYLYEMISEERLPFPVYKFGRSVRFRLSEVDQWIESCKHSKAC
jgi:excisionase family DNA binding protein